MHLYPRVWRRRYGAEFEALLEDSSVGLLDLADIAKGALEMQTRTIGMVALAAAIGLLVGFAGSFAIPRLYVAGKGFHFSATPEKVNSLVAEVLQRKSLVEVIDRHTLFEVERKTQPLEEIVEKMKRSVHVSSKNKNVFLISFTSGDPELCDRVVKDLTQRLVEENERQGNDTLVADIPYLTGLLAPNRTAVAVVGMMVGLLSGIVFFWFRRPRIVGAALPLAKRMS